MKMSKQKTVYSVRLSDETADKLASLSESTGKPMSWFIVKGIEHYMNRSYVKKLLKQIEEREAENG
jgi:predicted DNA-binding protein